MDEQTPRGVAGQNGRGGSRGRSASRRGSLTADVARSLWGNAKRAAKGDGKRKPWVSTADVIEHVWSQMAWAARPIPPLQKIMAAQAPMAGVILQDASKGTVIDRLMLQPAARAENRLAAANAMLGPPAWVMMISLWGGAHSDQATGAPLVDPETGQYLWDDRTQGMISGLRFSMMSWLKIADAKADEIQESSEEMMALGDEADKLISWILAPATVGQTAKEVEAEARAKGTGFIRAGTVGQARGEVTLDDATAALERQAGASAFAPVAATGSKG